jgi:hypothetical protein
MQLDLRTVDPPLVPLRIVDADNLRDNTAPPSRRLTVLLATDDPTFAGIVERALHDDCELTVCGSLADCIRKLRLDEFDAVLANLRSDTFHVGNAVRQQCAWRRPFLIAFADNGGPSEGVASKEAHDLLLPRQFDPGALLAVLGRLRSFLASIDSFDPMI